MQFSRNKKIYQIVLKQLIKTEIWKNDDFERKNPEKIESRASKSHLNEETLRFIEKLSPYQLIQAGSSLKFCRIAEGAADVYPRLGPTCEWGTATAQAIVEAAGGNVSDLDGTPLRYGKPEVLNPSFISSFRSLGSEGSLL